MANHGDQMGQRLLDFIKSEVETLHPPKASASIYKVPDELRNGNGAFFEPKTISIGPLHDLSPSKELKKWYLKAFISRLQQPGKGKDKLIGLMTSLELKCRECYRDLPDTLTPYDFLEIMLLDSCFIVELLLRHNWEEVYTQNVLGKEEKLPLYTLQQDLLKLENQLPFFILHALSDLAAAPNVDSDRILIESALTFFRIRKPEAITPERPRHLLELVMFALFPRLETAAVSEIKVGQQSVIKAKSASELEVYGVKFKPRNSTNLADIKFNHGVLEIPCLEIQESTLSQFWNFLIFDMCSSQHRLFTSYVVFMDSLVNNEKDVELLLRSGVLKTHINDVGRLVSLFNNLAANLTHREFHFEYQLRQVNAYCQSGFRPQRAYMIQNYYEARWDVLNSVLLFILTVTQTLFAVISYNPKQK